MTAIVANQNYRMTKRKLTAVETFTGNILEHMQDGVITLDAEGRVSLFNTKAQELFGMNEEAALGKSPDDLQGTSAASLQQLFTVTQKDSELTIRGGNDRERYLSVSVSRTLNEKGTVESTTAVVRDLTEARRLQQEMQRNEKLTAMGELAFHRLPL